MVTPKKHVVSDSYIYTQQRLCICNDLGNGVIKSTGVTTLSSEHVLPSVFVITMTTKRGNLEKVVPHLMLQTWSHKHPLTYTHAHMPLSRSGDQEG